MQKFIIWGITGLLLALILSYATGFRGGDKVLLDNVQVLTLHKGKMTNARRSRPIPQLQCTGGRAGCRAVNIETVQCYNRGSDGDDVQWECKTEMDKRYKFGSVEVNCEGYDYPDDPYILKGSCGLEYTVDYAGGGGGWGSGSSWFGGGSQHHHGHKKESTLGNVIMMVIIGLVVYAIYRSFRSGGTHQYEQFSSTNDDYPGGGYPGGGYPGQQPPPPGFRPEYMPGTGTGGGCGANRQGGQGNFGGFWTGAMTGGLLGYLMGNNNNRGNMYNRPYARDYGTGGGFFGSGGGGGSSFGGGGGSTQSTSGFGGTRRR